MFPFGHARRRVGWFSRQRRGVGLTPFGISIWWVQSYLLKTTIILAGIKNPSPTWKLHASGIDASIFLVTPFPIAGIVKYLNGNF